jgi:hypothetical protein
VLVDLARQLDELGREVELASLPGQIERIDGQAVAAQPRAGLTPMIPTRSFDSSPARVKLPSRGAVWI